MAAFKFTTTEFSALMETYLEQGMTYTQAYRAACEYEQATAAAICSAELELAD